MFKTYNLILDHAARELCRKLRKAQTEEEQIFWAHVRGRKFKRLKFYRQCPIFYETNDQELFFISDFLCFEKKTVIEIDGKIHDFRNKEDIEKTTILKSLGLKVIRLKNEDIEFDIKEVLKKLSIHFEDHNQDCR